MTKTELIAAVAEKANISNNVVEYKERGSDKNKETGKEIKEKGNPQ